AAGGAGGALDELAAVVVNWGTAELTIRCVRALVADGVPPGRVVVVDNGSEDDSHARLRRELPECPHLRIEKNVGYARAANAGARLLPGASAYLFVNNDAFVHRPGSVPALVASLGDASVGIVVARILNEDLTLQRQTVPIRTPAWRSPSPPASRGSSPTAGSRAGGGAGTIPSRARSPPRAPWPCSSAARRGSVSGASRSWPGSTGRTSTCAGAPATSARRSGSPPRPSSSTWKPGARGSTTTT